MTKKEYDKKRDELREQYEKSKKQYLSKEGTSREDEAYQKIVDNFVDEWNELAYSYHFKTIHK